MALNLKELGAALETNSVRQMAAILGLTIPPSLSIRTLIATFLEQAKPHEPIDLKITWADGIDVSWVDPGVGHFFRAERFNWNFWITSAMSPGDELDGRTAPGGATIKTSFHSTVQLVADRHYELHVQSFNSYGGEVLESLISVGRISTVTEDTGGGTGFDFEVDVGDPIGGEDTGEDDL